MAASTSLLERDRELSTIERVLDGVLAGDGALLTIEGEAGAGKTSLLDAAGRMAAARQMLVLRARGGEFERDFPHGVVRQLFEPLLADELRRRELLTGTAAMAAPVFELAGTDGGIEPAAIQHGLYWLAVDLAASAPLVLLVDDAQWADLASLQALAYVGRRIEGLPIFLAATVRSGECDGGEPLLDELRRESIARSIVPQPLSAEAAGQLVAEAGREPSSDFAEACRGVTAGNPLLLVELLRALDAERVEPSDVSAERLAEVAATGLAGSILARLARLGEHSVEIARAVAILEPNAEVRRVATLASLPVEAVAEECERLISAHLLFDERPLGYVHPLVRAAVLNDTPAPRRAAAHARAARILDDDGAPLDAIAAHLLLAEPAGEGWAVEGLRTAAAEALGRGVPDAAVRYLRRALREPPAKGDRLAVSCELGVALLRANDSEGLEVLRTVRTGIEDRESRAEVTLEIANSLALRGGCEEAVALLEESLSEVSDRGSPLGLLLRGYMLMGALWGLERVPEDALPGPGETLGGDTMAGRLLLQGIGLLHALGLGRMERALELSETVLSRPDALVDDAMAGLPPQGALVAVTLADRGDLTGEVFDLALDAAKRRGALGVAGGLGMRSYCHFVDGDLREAQADAEIAIPQVALFGLFIPLAIYLGAAVRTLTARGDFIGAEKLLAEFWGRRQLVAGIPGSLLLCARGELRHATGRHAEARHDFLAAAERVRWLPYANPEAHPWRIGLASCEAALGNGEEARRLACEAVELAREAGGERGLGIALRVRGTVAEDPETVELLREAVGVLGGTRARLQHAHALVELGAALRRGNHRREAREPLREGLDLAHRCGAVPLEERARTELAATGARPRKAVLSGLDSLTPSELRVARMAGEGMTNREIAQGLFVTAKTVETHLRHVYQKLDVAKRTELAGALE